MIQCRSGFQPLQLIGGHSVLHWNFEDITVSPRDFDLKGYIRITLQESLESNGFDNIATADTRVVLFICKP